MDINSFAIVDGIYRIFSIELWRYVSRKNIDITEGVSRHTARC